MTQIVPIKELRNTNEIAALCHTSSEPIFVTKNGYGELVVMSLQTYDRMLGISEIDAAITESEKALANGGELIDAKEALLALRKKYFG